MTLPYIFSWSVDHMDTFSEVKVAVLGFFLNIGEHSEKNSQLLYLLGFAAGKNCLFLAASLLAITTTPTLKLLVPTLY